MTGSADTRIRDYIKGVPQVNSETTIVDQLSKQKILNDKKTKLIFHFYYSLQVKFIDKLSFMFGVMCIVLTEFLALREPQWFTMVHSLNSRPCPSSTQSRLDLLSPHA